ncbi:hypothetical protein ACFOVU_19905 [Nocardiopsis sediminis]|uniref:Uncharacterized protein n=1 Tax=Nocardiopsis sediminis TaxID=1778267 RepID=A0ABV8FPU2_9ACTN
MAEFAKFHLSGDIEDARTVLLDVLGQHGYRFSWESPTSGLAEKGSKAKAMLLGALAVHYKYSLGLQANPDQSVTASISLGNTGISGGAIGFSKVRGELDTLFNAVRQAYEVKGLLRHVEAG